MDSDEKKTTKNLGGRPTDYKPEYCEKLIEHMTEGLSFEAFGGVVGVCKQTLYSWTDKYPAFLDAKQRATSLARLWWEKTGIAGLWNESSSEIEGKSRRTFSKSFNTGVWVFNMKNRFKDDWKEKHEIEHTNNPDNAGPQVILYLPKNGREVIEPEESPKKKKTINKKKKKKTKK